MRANHVFIADGNQYFNRPGPRVVETCEMIRQMIDYGTPWADTVAWDAARWSPHTEKVASGR